MIFSCLIENFREGLVYAVFELNRDYIVNYVCQERESEYNCCQGACYLNDKLEEVNGTDQDKDMLRFFEKGVDLYVAGVTSGYLYTFPDILSCSKEKYFPDSPKYFFQLYTRIFHPPRV
jgi:hypothetical protein